MKPLEKMSLEELWQLFPIILKAYNPNYPAWYGEEKASLLEALRGHTVCRISHIGSTAVAGLLAKPIVDILLELPKDYDVGAVAQLLQQHDWILMQQDDALQTLKLNKGYTPGGFAQKVYHLHVRPHGDWDELYFRDYLREHPDIARQYETLKLGLMKLYGHDRDAYTNAKSAFVAEHTQKARAEYAGRYSPR